MMLVWVLDSVFSAFEWVLDDVFGTGMDVLTELLGVKMLGYPYMQRAYLAAVCIAIIGPVIGTFLVHREISMIGDTLVHTAFAGVAVGLFLNATLSLSLSPLLTALIVAIITALLVELLIEHAGAYSDTSLAIVLTGGRRRKHPHHRDGRRHYRRNQRPSRGGPR